MGDVIPFRGNDSLRSLVAGLGDPSRDKMATTYYGAECLDDWQLVSIYKSNWLGRKIIDIPAMDAVRKGRDWQASQEQIQAIEAEENRLGFWGKLLEVKTKARLWGGAALFIGTGDADPSQPLVPERVGKGGLKYLSVISRRDIAIGEIDQNITSEYYGKPAYYLTPGAEPWKRVRVHPSRLAVFIGAPHSDPLIGAYGLNYGWGDSVLDVVYTALKQTDATAANIASLIFESNVDVFGIPEFHESLSDPNYAATIIERFRLAAISKGINKALLLDSEETYERKTISFVGLPDVMNTFMIAASGAADIPMTRLYGQAPAGMNSTGESDLNNYYDRVRSIQNLEMTPAIYTLNECLIRSALGSRPPEIFYTWAPLAEMSETELAAIGASNAITAKTLLDAGIFTSEEMRKAVTNQMVESGFYPGLDQIVEETGVNWQAELAPEPAPLPGQSDPAARPVPTGDAAPRTLYVRRDVLNGAAIIKWAKSQGFTSTLPASDLHVTITYSRTPVDWMRMGNSWDGKLTVDPGGPRLMDQFGNATVMLFANAMLTYRHDQMVDAGAQWDHPEYQPHITISYDGAPADLSKVVPYQGEIRLGPEVFEEVKEDWQSSVTEE